MENLAYSNKEERTVALSIIKPNSQDLTTHTNEIVDLKSILKLPNIPVNGLQIPDGYAISEEGVVNLSTSTKIISQPVILSGQLCDTITGKEQLEISFVRKGQWKTFTVNRGMLASRHAILTLADDGLAVNSQNAKDLIQYLNEFENVNLLNLPRMQSVTRLGWVGTGSKMQFIPYTSGFEFLGGSEFLKIYQAVHECGDTDAWIRRIWDARDQNFALRAELAASFAAPLMKLLHLQNFFLHLWGASGIGKSVAMHAAASIWGDPMSTVLSFGSTAVGLEKYAEFFDNLPLLINEREAAFWEKESDVSKFVYRLAEGISSAKGNRDGSIQSKSTWNLVILTNGEGPLLSERDKSGMKCRVLEISSDEMVCKNPREMEYFVSRNYGGAGKRWIALLQQALQTSGEEFRKQHQMFCEKFTCDDIHSRIIQNVATLALSDYLTAVNLFGQASDQAMESAMQFGEQLLTYVPKANEVKLTKRAWEWTLSWLAQNQNKLGKNKSGEQIGDFHKEDVYVIVRVYKDAFRRQFGLDPLLALRDFARDGYLIPHLQNKGKTLDVAHRIGGIPVKCYQFHIPQDDKSDFITG